MWLLQQRRAIVLLYHRVANLTSDPQLLSVSPRHFEEHVRIIAEHRPVALAELTRCAAGGAVPHRSVAVTFDDGYADNGGAVAQLEAANVPATIFVISGYVGGRREFWWDELESLLLHGESFPQTIQATIGGMHHTWRFDEAARRQSSPGQWNVLVPPENGRQRLYVELYQLLLNRPEQLREAVLDVLALQLGRQRGVRPGFGAFTEHELQTISRLSTIELGAHTVTHPVLLSLPRAAQREEIEGSRRDLERILGRPVTSFSYPYGGALHAGVHARTAAAASGFERACANVPEPITHQVDPFWIPRFVVRDWPGPTFRRQLDRWFRGHV